MLFTTMNNVGSTTLFNPVILQAHNFWPCTALFNLYGLQTNLVGLHFVLQALQAIFTFHQQLIINGHFVFKVFSSFHLLLTLVRMQNKRSHQFVLHWNRLSFPRDLRQRTGLLFSCLGYHHLNKSDRVFVMKFSLYIYLL